MIYLTPPVPHVDQLLSMRGGKIQELRFVPLEDWFSEPRTIARGPFWTPMQASFVMAIQEGGIKLCAHRWITVEGLTKSTRVIEEERKGHLTYMPRPARPVDQSERICARLGEDILCNFVDTTRTAIH